MCNWNTCGLVYNWKYRCSLQAPGGCTKHYKLSSIESQEMRHLFAVIAKGEETQEILDSILTW